MKIDKLKESLEDAAENLSIEFQRALISEVSTEDGLVPVLMDLGSNPTRYIDIFSDEIVRLGAAYYKTICAWTELDEMGLDADLGSNEFQEYDESVLNREDVLRFPSEAVDDE